MFPGMSSVAGLHGVGASPGDKKSKNKSMRGKKKSIFETYMSKEDVSEGLKRGTLIQVLKPTGCLSPENTAWQQSCILNFSLFYAGYFHMVQGFCFLNLQYVSSGKYHEILVGKPEMWEERAFVAHVSIA